MNKKIITRFAPSPTGELHVGGARTALFEYLAAKHSGGKFYLRIEDTDRERFVEGSDSRIVESLQWLGLVPDNQKSIVYQSARLEKYKEHVLKLINEGHAYVCTCSKAELEEVRKKQTEKGLPSRYSGKCRVTKYQVASSKELEELILKGAVVRMKMPEKGKVTVPDLIKGDVEFDLSLLDDQVILKSDGYPTYHLASVVDDHDMEITHVIRAEEWLASTPKHLVLYKMFGWTPPEFGHLPMVLASDRTKLSKRHGATSVAEYKELGYLPEALVNFMALLGWNPKDNREIFTLGELVTEFDLKNVNKAPAIFNIQKLDSINEIYLRQVASSKERVTRELKVFGVESLTEGEIELLGRGGFKTLKEMADYILELRKEPDYPAELLVFKKSTKEATLQSLKLASDNLSSLKQWNNEAIQQSLSAIVENNNLTNGDVYWPVRVALSGADKSPSPVELAAALGKEETLERINKAIKVINR